MTERIEPCRFCRRESVGYWIEVVGGSRNGRSRETKYPVCRQHGDWILELITLLNRMGGERSYGVDIRSWNK